MSEISKKERVEDIAYDFMLCAIFGAGTTLGAVVVISLTQLIWNR